MDEVYKNICSLRKSEMLTLVSCCAGLPWLSRWIPVRCGKGLLDGLELSIENWPKEGPKQHC